MKDNLKNILIKYTPTFLLEAVKLWKKNKRRKYLEKQKTSKKNITSEQLIIDLKKIGLSKGDSVLVHSSMSKIGYLENGPATLIDALETVIGNDGTLLMPAFPAPGSNSSYLKNNPVFDYHKTKSKMGAISEYFRLLPNVKRSLHPTDSVCALGPLADYYTNTHFKQITPYNELSPFRKIGEKKGKILMLGTTLNGACTNLHTLEDAVPFKYPVYDLKIFDADMIDENGNHFTVQTKVHNPVYSVKRNCDALKPIFEKENVLINGIIGEANSMLIDANTMLEVMLKYYYEYGVTMYTPFGENGQLKN